MPKIDGLLLTQYITFIHPSIKIIGVSSHSNEALVTEVLSEGALGFITKFFLKRESAVYQGTYGNRNILFEAMDAALDNKEYIDSLLFNHR
jgi:DNA-binding NarL/FixJ family response regulator